ncbi:MAG: hypothetical protein M3Y27_09910 [Acidobacteriota bacterium]|nr:hypothetical protein [Acidobacteriota bacterium]
MKLVLPVLLISLCAYAGERCETCVRDSNGRIHRSAMQGGFQTRASCPATGLSTGSSSGYVIDHIEPLACGGVDSPQNVQWETWEDAINSAYDKARIAITPS